MFLRIVIALKVTRVVFQKLKKERFVFLQVIINIMCPKTVIGVTGVVKNNLTEEERENILEGSGYDSLEQYASSKEEVVENLIVQEVFENADSIVRMDVEVKVGE